MLTRYKVTPPPAPGQDYEELAANLQVELDALAERDEAAAAQLVGRMLGMLPKAPASKPGDEPLATKKTTGDSFADIVAWVAQRTGGN